MRGFIAAVFIAGLLVAGCGGKDANSSSSVPSVAPTAGCEKAATEELYVTEMYECSRGTNVYLFNTSTARDSYRKVAEEFGSVVVGQGDTWLEVKP